MSSRRRPIVLVTPALLVLLWTHTGRACSCASPPDPIVALLQCDAVFEGEVLSIEPEDTAREEGVVSTMDWLLVRFRVLRAWRGVETEALTIVTHRGGASCGFSFLEGERYLVYARRSRGRLATDLCMRTAAIGQAWGDLRDLGPARWEAQP